LRPDWSDFRKSLPTKKHKKAFDEVFENAKLYTSFRSISVNPIVFESVMMGAVFHNYKTLIETGKKEEEEKEVSEGAITNETKSLTANKPQWKDTA
jgi:hypothetical protein